VLHEPCMGLNGERPFGVTTLGDSPTRLQPRIECGHPAKPGRSFPVARPPLRLDFPRLRSRRRKGAPGSCPATVTAIDDHGHGSTRPSGNTEPSGLSAACPGAHSRVRDPVVRRRPGAVRVDRTNPHTAPPAHRTDPLSGSTRGTIQVFASRAGIRSGPERWSPA